MTPRYNTVPGRRQRRSRETRFEALDERLEAAERRQRRLKNTLDAVAREAGVAVSGPCSECERSYTLVKDGRLFCPSCGDCQSL